MKHLTTQAFMESAGRALDTDNPPFARALCGVVPTMADLTSAPDRADCPRCRDLAATEGLVEPEAQAITHWRTAARILGVSEDTIARRRRAHDAARRCHFASKTELLDWWSTVNRPKLARPTAARATRVNATPVAEPRSPVDWTALAKELTPPSDGETS